jgi:N-acetyl sugar amidotransferase
MDTSDPDIHFDEKGICDHCRRYDRLKAERPFYSPEGFERIIEKIRKRGKSCSYDCAAGISGGTDSSYMLHKLKDSGLRVLAVHYDSGWNSEEAIHNVKTLTEKMKIDLYRFAVDFEEFRALQVAYLKAGVVDLDVPTDHALHGGLYKAAADNNVPFILTGHNMETEIVMPRSWVADKLDSRNVLDIYRKFGNGPELKTFPLQTMWTKFRNYNLRRIEMIFILNYLKYNKQEAGEELKNRYGWEPVRVKHGESIWTRFYQCHILPTRFNIDKRRAHFSNLILSGVMKRDDALAELEQVIYKDKFDEDKKLVLERYRITENEFEMYMKAPVHKHSDFETEKKLKELYSGIRNLLPRGVLNASTRH